MDNRITGLNPPKGSARPRGAAVKREVCTMKATVAAVQMSCSDRVGPESGPIGACSGTGARTCTGPC